MRARLMRPVPNAAAPDAAVPDAGAPEAGAPLPLRARRVRPHRVEAGARGDEERLPVLAAEAQVRGGFGDGDLAEQLALRGEDVHAVARAAPDAPGGVAADAVGDALVDPAKLAAAARGAVFLH